MLTFFYFACGIPGVCAKSKAFLYSLKGIDFNGRVSHFLGGWKCLWMSREIRRLMAKELVGNNNTFGLPWILTQMSTVSLFIGEKKRSLKFLELESLFYFVTPQVVPNSVYLRSYDITEFFWIFFWAKSEKKTLEVLLQPHWTRHGWIYIFSFWSLFKNARTRASYSTTI